MGTRITQDIFWGHVLGHVLACELAHEHTVGHEELLRSSIRSRMQSMLDFC